MHLDREIDELARAANGPEFAEGLRAFFEKRPADFTAGERSRTADLAAPIAHRPSPIASLDH